MNHTCPTKDCPICASGADTLEAALRVLEETPTHSDLQIVHEEIWNTLEQYPLACLIPPNEKSRLRTWCVSAVIPDTDYARYWTVPLSAHVARPDLVMEMRHWVDRNEEKEGAPARRTSRVLIAQGPKDGAVLAYDGPSITNEIEEAGLCELGDLGLDDAPPGLSIWEGDYIFEQGYCDGYPAPGESESNPKGSFRPLTDEEWGQLRRGELFL
jgi:hypothetical protein